MSIEGQGHFFTIYFPGFVCFVLYLAKISGERLQDHWSSGLNFRKITAKFSGIPKFRNFTVVLFSGHLAHMIIMCLKGQQRLLYIE